MLTWITIFLVLYSLYLAGRLRRNEENTEVLRAALYLHLETGEYFKSAQVDNLRQQRLIELDRWLASKRGDK